jgi:hypothetical protein
VTVNRGVGRNAGVVGRPTEQEQAGSPSTCGAERSRSLVSFSFPYPTSVTEETDADTVIKNEWVQIKGLLGRYAGSQKTSGQTDALYVAFPYFYLCWHKESSI